VGYRVNSKRGVQFRQWATRVLREHLVRGYSYNQTRLAERGLLEARQTLDLLARTLQNQALVDDTGRAVLDLIVGYAETWRLLLEYDEDRLALPPGARPASGVLDHARASGAIADFKRELMARKEATPLFGNPRGEALEGLLASIEQTMFGEPLYRSREEKAAHLLYFRRRGSRPRVVRGARVHGHVGGPSIAPGEPGQERRTYADVVLEGRLRDALARLNPTVSREGLDEAFRKLTRISSPQLVDANHELHHYLVNGVSVEYLRADGTIGYDPVRVVDFDVPGEQRLAGRQPAHRREGGHNRRPDVVVFVNGLPLAVIELKNAADENATIWTPSSSSRPTSTSCRRSSCSTSCSSSRTASKRASARCRRTRSASCPGAPSRARRSRPDD
jgi:hypothetical protein